METEKGFVISKQLYNYLRATKAQLLVSQIMFERTCDLTGLGYLFFDVTDSGMILGVNGKHRVEMSVGKWARQVLQNSVNQSPIKKTDTISIWDFESVKDRDIELFVNYIQGACSRDNYRIDVVSGKDIVDVLDRPHISNESRLSKSCMNGKGRYFGMITNNPETKMVVIRGEGDTLLGRALLWRADIGAHKVNFMDRFYTTKDYLDGVLIQYCQDNDIFRKKHYNCYELNRIWVTPEGRDVKVTASVDIATDGFRYYPFLDTFQYGGDGFISTDPYNTQYMYQCTNGNRDECGVLPF